MNLNRTHTSIIQSIIVTLAVLLTSVPVIAGPPPRIGVPSSYPGEIAGSSSMRWAAPYVLLEEVTIADKPTRKVTWYSKDGDILKEVSGERLQDNSYIVQRIADTTLIHSVHSTQSTKLLRLGDVKDSYIHVQDCGKHFYRQYRNAQGTYTDFYSNGSLVGTYGPHSGTHGISLGIGNSGSFVYSKLDSTAEHLCRVVSVDSIGNEVFSFNAEGPLAGLAPSPNGDHVIVYYNFDHPKVRHATAFAYFYSDDKITKVPLERYSGFLEWVPETATVIVYNKVEERDVFSLLALNTGKFVWSVNDPIEYHSPMVHRVIWVITNDYLILSGMAIRESIAHGPVIPNDLRGTIRMLAAIDIKTGELVAKWYEPTFSGRWRIGTGMPAMPYTGGRLIWYDNELYHVTDLNFSKIDFSEIKNLENGWVGPADSGAVYHDVMH
ncbi:MAG: hypothetical protein JSV52_03980 [Candidatus Zixiibacteriota bacterium]|nr:MAG: hypothetical protein JSV52_03980 [candidate division Zixibacteria bacterium]